MNLTISKVFPPRRWCCVPSIRASPRYGSGFTSATVFIVFKTRINRWVRRTYDEIVAFHDRHQCCYLIWTDWPLFEMINVCLESNHSIGCKSSRLHHLNSWSEDFPWRSEWSRAELWRAMDVAVVGANFRTNALVFAMLISPSSWQSVRLMLTNVRH